MLFLPNFYRRKFRFYRHAKTLVMKRILNVSIPILAVLIISGLGFVSPPIQPAQVNKHLTKDHADLSPFPTMTVNEFLSLTPKRYQQLTGKKLSLPQKVSLKIAQYKVKKMVRNNRQVDLLSMARDVDTNNFDILGFILGVVLGPLGVLIAYLIEGKGSATFSWAIIGALVWLGLFLLVVLVL